MNNGTIFDNILITDSEAEAHAHSQAHWVPFSGDVEKKAKEAWEAKKKEAAKPVATPAAQEESADAAKEVDGDKDDGKNKKKDEL